MIDLYLDDCMDGDTLIAHLRNAGYSVFSPRACGTRGWDDPDHLEFAAQRGYALMTSNPPDFRRLHNEWRAQGRAPSGILLVGYDNIVGKDMKPRDIIRALRNLLAANELHVLNHWR